MSRSFDSRALIQVYVRLVGEGTTVYRPTSGIPAGPDSVELLAPKDFNPSDEEWEFQPGSVVRIERRVLSEGEVFVAVGLYRGGP